MSAPTGFTVGYRHDGDGKTYQGIRVIRSAKSANSPGVLALEGIADDAVTVNTLYLWVDSNGVFRKSSTFPTNQDADGSNASGIGSGGTGLVINADVDAAAAIAWSKMAALTSAHILVGSAGNVATDVAVTGDVTITNAGVTAIGAGKVLNANVGAAAAIDFSKLAALPSADILVGSAGNVATAVAMSGDVAISNAGATTIQAGAVGASKIAGGAISSTDYVLFIGIEGFARDNTANSTIVKTANGNWNFAYVASQTYNMSIAVTEPIRTTASMGLKLTSIKLMYSVVGNPLTSGSVYINATTYADNSAPSVAQYGGNLGGGAQPYALVGADLSVKDHVLTLAVGTPAYTVTDLVGLTIDFQIVAPAGCSGLIHGAELLFTYTTQ